ncbi:hypothetical protein B0H17DRAFT_447714 [Mycena rosella]|uniref:TPR-like protein n=1 Tax=Mycena rosella TaxID=1033263 RepID=A0AAD7CF91_MYCRO|nr:hypothetical protein B0H17DRAFT_447714 [Mycena rosella]
MVTVSSNSLLSVGVSSGGRFRHVYIRRPEHVNLCFFPGAHALSGLINLNTRCKFRQQRDGQIWLKHQLGHCRIGDPQAIEGTDKGLGTPLDIHTHGEMSGYSGDLNDLQVAIMNSQEAANHTPGDHPDRADRLESLAAAFNSRYLRLGDLIDLEAALLSLQEAADLIPADHPARARHLASLAASLDSRYQRLGDLKDLEAALQKAQEVADLTPADHPERARRLSSLAASLDSRYQILGDPKDLQAASKMRQEVVDLTAADHPDLAEHLQVLAGSFTNQHHSSGDPQDSAAVHQNYAASFRHSVNPESSRDANLQWASALQWTSFAKADDPSYVPAAYSAAFTLLPEILWVGNTLMCTTMPS